MKNYIIKKYYNIRWHLWDIKHQIFKLTHKELFNNPEKYIPKNTVYCYTYKSEISWTSTERPHGEYINCPFWRKVPFLPYQQNGYCHYLDKADIELNPEYNRNTKIGYAKNKEDEDKSLSELFGDYFPISLLWDECKECGVNDDIN